MLSKFPIDLLLLFPACRQNSNVNKNNRVDEAEVNSYKITNKGKRFEVEVLCGKNSFQNFGEFFLIQIRITIESQMTLNYNG